MAILSKFYKQREDGVNLFITYDDRDVFEGDDAIKGYKIKQKSTGILYVTAVDVEGLNEYEETEEQFDYTIIPPEPSEEATIEDYKNSIEYIKGGDV